MKNRANDSWSVPSRSLVAIAVSAALGTTAVRSQETQPSDTLLGEVIVTATKREENIQDVPISMTAVTGEQLIQGGVTDILSLDLLVPGLEIENSGNDPTPIIRGAGVAGTTDLAVPVYIDGVYQPNAGQALVSFLDLDRIEVLKGPQGTLFGRNTLGGLINVVSKQPSLKGFDAGVAVTAGDYAERKVEGFVNVPIAETLALRITGAAEKRDPFVKNLYNANAGLKDADYSYGRAQLLWQATDALSLTAVGTYWHDTANGNGDFGYKVLGIPVNPTTHVVDGITGILQPRQGLLNGWGGGKPAAGNVSDGDTSALIYPSPYQVAWDYTPHRDIKETSGALNIKWDLPGNQLRIDLSQFQYRELRLSDGDLSTMPAYVSGQLTQTKSQQIDINLNSTGTSKLKYTLGAYFFNDSTATNNSSAFLFGYTYTSPQKPTWAYWEYKDVGGTKSTALYGQADYSLTEKLTATAGVRWSHDVRNSYQLNVDQSTLNDTLPGYGGPPVNVANGSSSHVDWKGGLEYNLAKDVMLYAYEATGYIAGSTQELTNKLLAPQTNRTVEAGVKSTTLDGTLRFNLAIYSAAYTGLTTTIFVPVGNTILAQQVPGGSINSRGVEIESTLIPIHGMQITLGVAADRSTFNSFQAADRLGTNGSSYVDSTGQGWFILNNQVTSFSPDLTVNLGASYQVSLGNFGSITPSGVIKYSDSYKTTSEPYFWSVQPQYVMVNLAATWRSTDGKFSVKGFVDNLTNKAVMTEGTVYSGDRAVADFTNPRFWGFRLAYNF